MGASVGVGVGVGTGVGLGEAVGKGLTVATSEGANVSLGVRVAVGVGAEVIGLPSPPQANASTRNGTASDRTTSVPLPSCLSRAIIVLLGFNSP